MLKSNAELVHISLELLLLADRLALGAGLVLQGGLHRLDGLLVGLAESIQLVGLLLDPPLDLLLHLGQLQLGPENLVLLLLKSTFGFLEGSLELQLFSFKPLSDFVNLVDGSTTLADLVHDILDLGRQVLIFMPDAVELAVGLVVGGLHLEQLRRVASALHLSLVQLGLKAFNLVLPFGDNFVKVTSLLFHRHATGFRIFNGNDSFLNLSLQLGLLPLKSHCLPAQVADTDSSALARPSFSYFCLHIWESPTDLESRRKASFLDAPSSSSCPLVKSTSCSRFLYLPRRKARSFASLSPILFTSLS